MTDYTKLVEALRGMDNGDSCPCEYYMMCKERNMRRRYKCHA